MSIRIRMDRLDNKTHLNLSIDTAVVQSAREKGLNISRICEDSLRQILNVFEFTTKPENCKHKWTWPFSIPSGLAKECLWCGVFEKVKVETIQETNKVLEKVKL